MWKPDVSVKPSPAATPPRAMAAPTEMRAVENVVMDLGTSVVIKGELSASEDLTLYGQMDGRVTLRDHTLTIGPHADIRAEVVAKVVVIQGTVTGNVTGVEKVDVQATGSVNGDIVAPHFAMADGARLHGKVRRA
jgi:cytoskeletal protein CcmA (bactofilin family)